jgi:hypothetical protein
MSTLRTNTITIRGRSFTVAELSAKGVRDSRKVNEKEPYRFDLFVASLSAVEPKFTEAELADEPNIFAKKIAAEALRLTAIDESEKPNDPKPEAPTLD